MILLVLRMMHWQIKATTIPIPKYVEPFAAIISYAFVRTCSEMFCRDNAFIRGWSSSGKVPTVAFDQLTNWLSPCSPRTLTWMSFPATASSLDRVARRRIESSSVPVPKTCDGGSPLSFWAINVIVSTGLLTSTSLAVRLNGWIDAITAATIALFLATNAPLCSPGRCFAPAHTTTISDCPLSPTAYQLPGK